MKKATFQTLLCAFALCSVMISTNALADSAPSITDLITKADVAAGKKVAQQCMACHSFDKGGSNRVGPNLWAIVDRPKSSAAGYAYSPAMLSQKDQKWSIDNLNAFLYNPKAAVPGTKMPFAGVKNDQDRANVIAWLQTLSDTPAK